MFQHISENHTRALYILPRKQYIALTEGERKFFLIDKDYYDSFQKNNLSHDLRKHTTNTKHLFSQYGAPRFILTDRGESFINNLFRKLSKKFGVKQINTSGYRPQSNGSLARSHAVLMDYIRAYTETYGDIFHYRKHRYF